MTDPMFCVGYGEEEITWQQFRDIVLYRAAEDSDSRREDPDRKRKDPNPKREDLEPSHKNPIAITRATEREMCQIIQYILGQQAKHPRLRILTIGEQSNDIPETPRSFSDWLISCFSKIENLAGQLSNFDENGILDDMASEEIAGREDARAAATYEGGEIKVKREFL